METARSIIVGCQTVTDPFGRVDCALEELLKPKVCGVKIDRQVRRDFARSVKRARQLVTQAEVTVSSEQVGILVNGADKKLRSAALGIREADEVSRSCRKRLGKMVKERRALLDALR